MSCLRSSHSYLHSLIIPHFSQKNHIRALAQRSPQSREIAGSIRGNLTLADNTFFMAVKIFQRIFQGNDMFFPVFINIVNDTGQSGRLAAACASGYQDHSLIQISQMDDSFRDSQFLGRWKRKGNDPDHSSCRTPLHISIYPETADPRKSKGKVIISPVCEGREAAVGCHSINILYDPKGVLRHQPLLGILPDLIIQTVRQGTACHNKNVRSL